MRHNIPIDGRRLHVREEGAGEPVLLVHGLPTNGLLWKEVAPALAERARVIVPDLLGFGASDRPAGLPVSLDAHAGYLLRVLDSLGVGRATVVGHDIGGGVAQILAVRHPERVAGLGLIDCVAYDNWPVWEMRAIRLTAPLFAHLPAGPTAAAIGLGLRRGFEDGDRARRYLPLFLDPFAAPGGMRLLVEHTLALHARQTEAVAPGLPGVRVPAAVVWGARDPFFAPRWGERLAADIPGARLTLVDAASHFSPADAPDAVAKALLDLLLRVG